MKKDQKKSPSYNIYKRKKKKKEKRTKKSTIKKHRNVDKKYRK